MPAELPRGTRHFRWAPCLSGDQSWKSPPPQCCNNETSKLEVTAPTLAFARRKRSGLCSRHLFLVSVETIEPVQHPIGKDLLTLTFGYPFFILSSYIVLLIKSIANGVHIIPETHTKKNLTGVSFTTVVSLWWCYIHLLKIWDLWKILSHVVSYISLLYILDFLSFLT